MQPKEDNVYSGPEAITRLIVGFDKVANVVKTTLGAAGSNFITERFEYPYAISSNDGVTLAQDIQLADPVERMGANLAKEIATRSDRQSHDGTTSAITLAQAILHEGMTSEASPMELKRSLEDCLPIIEASIKAQTKEIDVSEVGRVAAISAEDPQIGALIQEIYEKIGKEGILFRDISQTFTDHYEVSKGIQLQDAGFASPYMVDIDKDGRPLGGVHLKDPYVLVTKKLISIADLEVAAYGIKAKNKTDLVIFCEDYEPQVLSQCAGTRMKSGFRFIIVKLPVLWRDQWLEDVAIMTGTKIIDGISFPLKSVTLKDLGTCESVEISKTDTFFGGIQDISAYLETLNQGTDEDKIRAARLNRNSARLYVGAPTDQALSYRRLKVEDATGAAWNAMHGGVCAGGGVALLNAANEMPLTVGGKILAKALAAPFLQIVDNAGGNVEFGDVNQPLGGTMGYDAKSHKIVDMFEAGILDPATVVMNSARNAISVAATVLSTRTVVTLNKQAGTMM